MLPVEADELGRVFTELPVSAMPLLHLGSSTLEYRQTQQPWVGAIFQGLEERDSVVHADLKTQDGVDVVADFTTPEGRAALKANGTRSVLCSNLLEHVTIAPWDALDLLTSLVAPGGYVIVTGPTVFGLHPDPIDNGFRPTAREVAEHLPSEFEVVTASQVRDRRLAYYYADQGRSWGGLAKSLIAPRDRSVWASTMSTLTKRAEAFVVVGRRLQDSPA